MKTGATCMAANSENLMVATENGTIQVYSFNPNNSKFNLDDQLKFHSYSISCLFENENFFISADKIGQVAIWKKKSNSNFENTQEVILIFI